MAFDADLLSLMSSLCTHKATSGHDGWGTETVSTTTANVPCHVTYETRIIRGDAEENATSTAQIQCPPGGWQVGSVLVPTIAIDDHVTLADGIERRVLTVHRYTDDSGFWHQGIDLT